MKLLKHSMYVFTGQTSTCSVLFTCTKEFYLDKECWQFNFVDVVATHPLNILGTIVTILPLLP